MQAFLAGLKSAPFPYLTPEQDAAGRFFDKGTRLRTSGGEVHSYEESYADGTVLFVVPSRFDPARPFDIVVYFHGFETNISVQYQSKSGAGKIWYGLDVQMERSGRNAILIAPQLPKNARDGFPGKLWRPGAAAALLDEARDVLATRLGGGAAFAAGYDAAPVILMSYSGGYQAAARFVDRSTGVPDRVRAMFMLDSIYGQTSTFEKWIRSGGAQGIFVSQALTTYLENASLWKALGYTAAILDAPPINLSLGDVKIYKPSSGVHGEAPLKGPPPSPLAWFLSLLPALPPVVPPNNT